MERFRNWQGWAALALAGLALLFAIGGRGPFGGREYDRMVTVQAPVAPASPDVGSRFGRGVPPEVAADVEQRMSEAHGRFERGFAGGHGHGHGFGRGFERGWGGPFALFGLLRGLLNLAALGLLGFVLLTVWRQRRAATSDPAGPAPTTPAGHDPRVE